MIPQCEAHVNIPDENHANVSRLTKAPGLFDSLGDRDWRTLCALALFADDRGVVRPSRAVLARKLKVRPSTVSERIQRLIQMRWKGQPLVQGGQQHRADGTWGEGVYTIVPLAEDIAGAGDAMAPFHRVGVSRHGDDPHGRTQAAPESRETQTAAVSDRVGISRHGEGRHVSQTIQDLQDHDLLSFFPDRSIQELRTIREGEESPPDPQTPMGSSDLTPRAGHPASDGTANHPVRSQREKPGRGSPQPRRGSGRSFSPEARALAVRLKARLRDRGVTVFPSDWHVKALASADFLLKTLTAAEVEALMDWALAHPFWGPKTTTMHRLVTLAAEWQQVRGVGTEAEGRRAPPARQMTIAERNMALLRRLYAETLEQEQEVTEVDATG